MIIIIDGYNVLKRIDSGADIGQRERDRFASELARYGQAKKHSIVLVFDGGPSSRPVREHKNGAQVIYAGTKSSADEYIAHYAQDHRNQDLMVVSADRALCRLVVQFGATCIDPEAFMYLLRAKKDTTSGQKSSAIIKTSEKDEVLLDELMQEAGKQEIYKPHDQGSRSRRSPNKDMSKNERVLIQKVKKL